MGGREEPKQADAKSGKWKARHSVGAQIRLHITSKVDLFTLLHLRPGRETIKERSKNSEKSERIKKYKLAVTK